MCCIAQTIIIIIDTAISMLFYIPYVKYIHINLNYIQYNFKVVNVQNIKEETVYDFIDFVIFFINVIYLLKIYIKVWKLTMFFCAHTPRWTTTTMSVKSLLHINISIDPSYKSGNKMYLSQKLRSVDYYQLVTL